MRQPVRNVGPDAEAVNAFRHLLIGIIIAAGSCVGLWLFGLLGYTVGFAPAMRIPDLACDAGLAFTASFRVIMSTPELVLEAGVEQTGWMMLGFILIALPAAGLSAIRPFPPGGPRPPMTAQVFSWIGAFAAIIASLLTIAWIGADMRTGRLADIPSIAADSVPWLTDLRVAAGLDALAVIALALWALLTMRLVIPGWLRALSAACAFPALVLMTMAFAASSVTATQVAMPRSVCYLETSQPVQPWRLIIGHSDNRLAALVPIGKGVRIELRATDSVMDVHERLSIPEFLLRPEW
ncbi:MAG: hypothetical protein KC983_02645 [Phycisphaerales bacterium]|nr:hypothetical protein [Phycisphaerales bacterium]